LTILDALQNISLAQIQLAKPDAKLEGLDKSTDISQDHWVASVLLDTSKAEIYFRVHFSTVIGRALLADHLKSDPTSFDPASALDHLKEYCNVIMGRIKGALTSEMDSNSITKVFLPSVDPSYDRYKIIPTGNEKVFEERWWRIVWGGGEFILFARVKSAGGFGESVLKSLSQVHVILVDNQGEIEML